MSQGGDAGRAAVEWNGQVSAPSHHLFINASPEPLTLTWGPRLLLRPPPPPPRAGAGAGAGAGAVAGAGAGAGEGAAGGEAGAAGGGAAGGGAGDVETPHPEPVAPRGGVLFVGTYEFHTWRVRSAGRGLICAHDGPPSVVEVTAAGDYIISPYTPERHQRAIAAAAAASAVAAAGATAAAVGATAAIPPAEVSSLQQQQAGRQQQAGSAEEGQQGQQQQAQQQQAQQQQAQQQQAQQQQAQHVFVNLLPAPGAGQEGAGQEGAGQEDGAGRRRWLWLSWGDAEGRHDTPHPVPVPPGGGCVSVGASDAVTWRVRTAAPPAWQQQPGRLVASHSGPPSIVVIGAAGDDTDAAGTAAVMTVSVEPYSVARHTHWLYPHLRPHPLQLPAATAAAASHPSHIQAHTPAQQQQQGSMHPHPQHQPPPPPPPDSPLVPAAAAAPPLAGGASSPAYALGHVSSRHAATAATGTRAAAATAAAATASAPAPLSAAASGATLHKDLHTVEWKGQVSASSYHLFVNDTREPLQLSWGDGAGHTEVPHGDIPPCGNLFVGTYEFHTWRVRSASRGLICAHTGPSAIVTITPHGASTHLNTTTGAPPPPPSRPPAPRMASSSAGGGGGGGGGRRGRAVAVAAAVAAAAAAAEPGYRQRGEVLGMPIWAFDCVSDAAVGRLGHVVGRMLAAAPGGAAAAAARLRAGGAGFAVFGRKQVVSDVPAHRLMRYNAGRHLDTSARGLGATPAIPVTSCGEENLTMVKDRWYPCQSILVHEVGHAVHNLGLTAAQVAGVMAAYTSAMEAGRYPADCYMASNEQEYWAVGVEAWFESSIRTDVSSGPQGGGLSRLTRAELKRHDPPLAALMEAVWGDGEWRYWQDCPQPLAMPTRDTHYLTAPPSEGEEEGDGEVEEKGERRHGGGPNGAAAASASAAAAASGSSWRTRRPARLRAVGRGTFDFDPEEEEEQEEEEEGEDFEDGDFEDGGFGDEEADEEAGARAGWQQPPEHRPHPSTLHPPGDGAGGAGLAATSPGGDSRGSGGGSGSGGAAANLPPPPPPPDSAAAAALLQGLQRLAMSGGAAAAAALADAEAEAAGTSSDAGVAAALEAPPPLPVPPLLLPVPPLPPLPPLLPLPPPSAPSQPPQPQQQLTGGAAAAAAAAAATAALMGRRPHDSRSP